MCGLTLGFFAVVLCFVGMDCTYIGGGEKIKDQLLFSGAVFHFCGGQLRGEKKNHKRRGGKDASPSWSPRIQHYVCLQVWPISPATAYTSTGSPGQALLPIWHRES